MRVEDQCMNDEMLYILLTRTWELTEKVHC